MHICPRSSKIIIVKVLKKSLGSKRPLHRILLNVFGIELNSKFNYPIKRALISIIEENDYSMSVPVLKYCVSWITNYIC